MNECRLHAIPGVQGGVKFKPIDEFPGYWIGEDGTVVSTRRGDPHVLRVDYNADGYVRVRLFNRLGRYNYFVHRLVAEAFIHKGGGQNSGSPRYERREQQCLESEVVPEHEGEHGQPAECRQKTEGGGKQTQPRSEEEGIHGGDHETGNDGHSVLIFFGEWKSLFIFAM